MTVLLLDFFGTLVDYCRDRTSQGFRRSHALLPELSYADFLARVDEVFAGFDARSALDDSEFSMREISAAVLDSAGSAADPAVFEQAYMAEWQTGVTELPGLRGLLAELHERHRLAVVSNTHSPTMVPGFLTAWGVAGLFDTVVLSVEVGRRKPHPLMYATALRRLGVDAAEAVFVGDSYDADYAGPVAAGIPALLIDPAGRHDVPPASRLASIFELPGRLAALERPA
jgi:putative hydrolase of the HAD superfamily